MRMPSTLLRPPSSLSSSGQGVRLTGALLNPLFWYPCTEFCSTPAPLPYPSPIPQGELGEMAACSSAHGRLACSRIACWEGNNKYNPSGFLGLGCGCELICQTVEGFEAEAAEAGLP